MQSEEDLEIQRVIEESIRSGAKPIPKIIPVGSATSESKGLMNPVLTTGTTSAANSRKLSVSKGRSIRLPSVKPASPKNIVSRQQSASRSGARNNLTEEEIEQIEKEEIERAVAASRNSKYSPESVSRPTGQMRPMSPRDRSSSQERNAPSSPRRSRKTLEEIRRLRAEQEIAYEESMRMDTERERKIILAAEEARKAEAEALATLERIRAARIAAEEREQKIRREIRAAESSGKLNSPPRSPSTETLRVKMIYPVNVSSKQGKGINSVIHTFSANDPVHTLFLKARKDMDYYGNIDMVNARGELIIDRPHNTLHSSGIVNNSVVRISILDQ